jgi:hypothetical protein
MLKRAGNFSWFQLRPTMRSERIGKIAALLCFYEPFIANGMDM